MKKKLKSLATVQMGYSFRTRLEASDHGGIAVIQMKDLQDDNTVNCDDLIKIEFNDIKDRHLTQKYDLVFRSRGLLTASAILLEDPGRAVIAAPLLRIRVKDPGKILPGYLNWYISQRDAQIFLTSRAKGSVQKMISKQAIEDLEVVLPDLETQKRVVELAALSGREQALLDTLGNKRKQYIEAVLMQFSMKENK